VLIFTEYRETQKYIVTELEREYGKGCVVVIHGHMKLERREELGQEVAAIWPPFAAHGALNAPTTKRTSQRLFRDHPKVRFLVSTEAGGEGINLQFSHICVNYDLPWNPMRVEQRVGRVYRFGQKLVVQVYNFFNRGTIEDTVQLYFENRIRRSAEAISTVTGEDPEDIMGTLNGQLESEIDPTAIYQRAMVEGNLNRQTKAEIDQAVVRAQRAYEIATQSLFRDASCYSFDQYRRELKTDLSLEDLQRFTERFMAKHRRQMQARDDFVEFLTPDALKAFSLPERYRTATFDRELAIRRPDAEFLALGHPFIDSMLSYVGSYDFGGLTAIRWIAMKELAGISGFLFVFVVRRLITREDGDECLFDFHPVFVRHDGEIDDKAANAAVHMPASDTPTRNSLPDVAVSFEVAQTHLQTMANLWDWEENVEFIGTSWVEFI
jgi:hypothetical protein